MLIANEMQDELQRHDPFFRTGRGSFEFRRELVDLIDNTGLCRSIRRGNAGRQAGMAEARLVQVGRVAFDIDEMPEARSFPRPVLVPVAVFVGPGGLGGDGVLGQGSGSAASKADTR